MQSLMQIGRIVLISVLSFIGLEKEGTKANSSNGSRSSKTIYRFGNRSVGVSHMPHIPICNTTNSAVNGRCKIKARSASYLHTMRLSVWLTLVVLIGCATVPRDDFKLRRDIAGMNLVKMPLADARTVLSGQGFACDKESAQYAGSFLRTAFCTRAIPGIGCRDEEQVTLEYGVESGLVDRVATGRKNACN